MALGRAIRGRLSPAARLSLVVALIGATAVFSLSPYTAPPSTNDVDKLVHVVGYGVLTAVIVLLFLAPIRVGILVFLASASFELFQEGVRHRSGSWGDLAANACGIALAVFLWALMRRLERPCGGFGQDPKDGGEEAADDGAVERNRP